VKLTNEQCEEIVAICAARNAAGRVFDSAPRGFIIDEPDKGDVRGLAPAAIIAPKGAAPEFWIRRLVDLLQKMMADPLVAATLAPAAETPAAKPDMTRLPGGDRSVPPVVPPGGPRDAAPSRRLDDLVPPARHGRALGSLVDVIHGR
jgi:hypothetical protein